MADVYFDANFNVSGYIWVAAWYVIFSFDQVGTHRPCPSHATPPTLPSMLPTSRVPSRAPLLSHLTLPFLQGASLPLAPRLPLDGAL